MKLTVALLLLSPAFAKPDSKAAKYAKAKFSKAKGKAAKSAGYYRRMSMSASMSVGPPPITLTGCGESFTNEKVVLLEDLNCGSRVGVVQDCAVTLDGPQAEINCKDNTLSQIATSQENYDDGPFISGICLSNGAKARNCNVQQFIYGIEVINGGEVVKSNLSPNTYGMYAAFNKDATLTIENTDASNNEEYGLYVGVDGDGTNAELIVKGIVTANSNGFVGMYTTLSGVTNAKLEINVEDGSILTICGNGLYDIYGFVLASNTVDFSGDGYTCDQIEFTGAGTVVPPNCQACPRA